MQKIKVLQIVGKAIRGGVEAYILTYFRLCKDNCDFTFVFFDNSEHIPYDLIKELGGHIELVPSISHLFKFNKALKKILKSQKYDIVHSHLNTLSVFPLRIAKKCNVKVRIAQSHTTSNKKEKIRNLIKNVLKHFSTIYPTHFFAVTMDAGIFQFGRKNKDKITVVPALIESEKFMFNSKMRNELRNELGYRNDDIIIGNIGRLCSQKNQHFLIELANKLKDISTDYKVLIIGDGGLKDELSNQISKYALDNVKILPSKVNIYDYYNVFDLFALPSIYEGFGIVTIEAQANGLYCLVSEFPPKESLPTEYGKFLKLDLELWVNEVTNYKTRDIKNFEVINEIFGMRENNALLTAYNKCLK